MSRHVILRASLNNRPAKTLFLLVIVIVTAVALLNLVTGPDPLLGRGSRVISAGQVFTDLHRGRIKSIEWQLTHLSGEFRDGGAFTSTYVKPSDPAAVTLTDLVRQINTAADPGKDVHLTILDPPASSTMLNLLSVAAFPLALIAIIYFLVLRPTMNRRP